MSSQHRKKMYKRDHDLRVLRQRSVFKINNKFKTLMIRNRLMQMPPAISVKYV